jgi:hypothetical protein
MPKRTAKEIYSALERALGEPPDEAYLPPVAETEVAVVEEGGRFYVYAGRLLAVCGTFPGLQLELRANRWVPTSFKQSPVLADRVWW